MRSRTAKWNESYDFISLRFFFFSSEINFMEVFNSFEIFWNYSKNIQLLNVRYDVKDEEGDDQRTTY